MENKRYIFSSLNHGTIKLIRAIGQYADKRSVRAYVVGGFVRDLLLKRKNFDVDIVLESSAIRFAKSFAKTHDASVTVYERFRTATLCMPNGRRVDLATARKEDYPQSGSLPVVHTGSLSDDIKRRDFTINAMAVCINMNRFGELCDECGGLADLKEKKIRILHKRSFIDDPTRILRAVRFEQRFRFALEPDTLRLLKSALKARVVNNVKRPRYFEEFKKTLKEPHAGRALRRLKVLGALKFLEDEVKGPVGLSPFFERSLERFDRASQRWIMYFLAIINRVPYMQRQALADRFCFSNEERAIVLEAVKTNMVIKELSTEGLKPSDIYQVLKPLPTAVILFARVSTKNRRVIKRIDDFLNKYDKIQLDINGHDLKRLKIATGKRMGQLLRQVLFAKIDGVIQTKKQQINHVKRLETKR